MYRRIMVPVDGSTTSLKGLEEAVRLAKALGAKLKLIHVVNELVIDSPYQPTMYYEQIIGLLREGGRKVLAAAESSARRQDVPVEAELIETIGGRAADAIIQAAKQWSADVIVMGTHGRRGLSRLALGSDAEFVLRSSRVPVLIVRGTAEG